MFGRRLKSALPGGIVCIVDDMIIAGDIDAGDLIALPESADPVLVKRVRVGQGGFILTVAPVGDDRPEQERLVTLSADVRLRKHGRHPVS
jgi:hypothetical protein